MIRKLVFGVALICVAGCSVPTKDDIDPTKDWTRHGYGVITKVTEIEGHKYIIMRGRDRQIVHAASCPCMDGKGGPK